MSTLYGEVGIYAPCMIINHLGQGHKMHSGVPKDKASNKGGCSIKACTFDGPKRSEVITQQSKISKLLGLTRHRRVLDKVLRAALLKI